MQNNPKRIPVCSGARILEFVHPGRAEYLATRPNVEVVRARKTRQIVRLLITERVDAPDRSEHPVQDSNVTTFEERLFTDEDAAPVAGQRLLVQHKGLFCGEEHSWLSHWAEIRREEMAEVYRA